MRKVIAAIGIAMALCGCASVPMGDASQDAALKAFTVAPNRAGIYVYRNESMGAAIKMDVAIDGVSIGQTAAKTFLFTEVAPGRHTIMSKAEDTDLIEVNVGPGTLTYVWQEVKMGVLYARTKLHVVDEAQGQRGVQETKLAATARVGSSSPTPAPAAATGPVSATARTEAQAPLGIGSRLTFRASDPFTGASYGESTFVLHAGEANRLTFNDGSIVVAMDGRPIHGVLHDPTIYGIGPSQLARGGTWKGSFRTQPATEDVPVDITMVRSEEKVISGRSFQAARLRVKGFATRQLLQGHATNSMGAAFEGDLLVDKATGLVLEARVTSVNHSYAYQRALVRIAAN